MQSQQGPSQHGESSTATSSFNVALRRLLSNAPQNTKQKVDDLLLVILTLCPFAFWAYDDAIRNHGWMEYREDGCIVQHLSWNIFTRHFKEVLRITLERAQNLPVPKTNGGNGRYFVFSNGSSRERSEDKWSESNPGWNKSHYLLIQEHYQEGKHDHKLSIELHNSGTRNSENNEQPLFHMATGKKCLGSASISMSKVLTDEETFHAPSLDLRESKHSDRDTSVTIHTKRISLFDAWKDSRKGIEPNEAWEQQMPRSKKACDWALLNEENIGGFKPVGFINAVKRGTQVWIYADHNTKTIAIAFRGTEKTKKEDVQTVFQFLPSRLHWKSTGSCKLKTTLNQIANGMRLHAGFLKAYDAVRIALLEMVYSITQWNEEWTICLTGHSLGGALAVLCSFDYIHLTDTEETKPEIFMMSFGAPKVGNKVFKDAYEAKVKHAYRVACGKDFVCGLPLHFHHVGQHLRFNRFGRVRFNEKLVSDVKVEAENIENEIAEGVIRKWNSQSYRSFNRHTTMRNQGMQDPSLAQEESSRRTLSRCQSSRRVLMDLNRTTAISRSISQKKRLHAPSVNLQQVQLNRGGSTASLMPSIVDHGEERYHHFATSVARRVAHCRRHMHHNRHRCSEKFRSVIKSIQERMAHQQQDSDTGDQHHQEQREQDSV